MRLELDAGAPKAIAAGAEVVQPCRMEKLQYIRMPFDLGSLPEGWFSKGQINILYQLALQAKGPILEVGPWVGRSTAVICQALQQRPDRVPFDTVDYGIASAEEWKRLFGDDLSKKLDPEKYLRHINQPEGTITSLRRNLTERGFEPLVTIHRGDFHEVCPDGKFALIFCDATHSIAEIDANVPALVERLVPGGILACDDIHPAFEMHLRTKYKWKWAHLDSLLFYGEPDTAVSS